MRKIFNFFVAILFFILLQSLIALPIGYTPVTSAICVSNGGYYASLPKLSFTITPPSIEGGGKLTAQLTSPQSVIDQWIAKDPVAVYVIQGFKGPISDANLISITNARFIPQNLGSRSIDLNITDADLENGNVSFYLFPASAASIDNGPDCQISNRAQVSYTKGDPDAPPDQNNQECDETGVGIGGKTVCVSPFECKKQTDGKYRCISTSHSNAPISRPCKDGWSIEKGCSSISTAIGDVTTQPNSFISFLLGIVLSLAGVILLLLLIINGYKLMTSQGDPEKIKDAREGIIAAISGILLIIFSLVILEFITVNILGIPGFGS